MKKLLGLVLLAFGIVAPGSWSSAYGQTGDCFATLPGCLDQGFGVNGRVTEPAGMTINAITIQKVNGVSKIIAVGKIGTTWAIARYSMSGQYETTFGLNHTGTAYAVAVQPGDDMLLVAGSEPTEVYYRNKRYVRDQTSVLRYKADGTADLSFGTGGTVKVPDPDFPASPTTAHAIALQSDGRIVVLGTYAGWMGVARLLPNGLLDTSFSENGDGQYVYEPTISAGYGLAIEKIGDSEYIVVAGEDRSNWNFLVFRLTPFGSLDWAKSTSFADIGSTQEIYDQVAVDSAGRIVAAGTSWPFSATDVRMVVGRYLPDGSLDQAFQYPNATYIKPGLVSPYPSVKQDSAHAIAIQAADGRIVVAGESIGWDNLRYVSLWRFNADGSPDLSLGMNGWVSTLIPNTNYQQTTSVLVNPDDGKIIVAGTRNYFSAMPLPYMTRYFGSVPPQYEHDVAVYNVSASPVLATQGEAVQVKVAVGNNGTQLETATVSVTETPVGANPAPQVVSLEAGKTTMLTFAWPSATSTIGPHTLTAVINTGVADQEPQNDAKSTTVNVAAPITISLSARAYRGRSDVNAELTWNVTSAATMDLYKGSSAQTLSKTNLIANTGKYTEWAASAKSSGTWTYKLCETGSTTRCSNTATVTF